MQTCATCGDDVPDDGLVSERGEPICFGCSTGVELARERERTSRILYASSAGALGLGMLALFFDPCFMPTTGAVALGAAALNLLARDPEQRARTGARGRIAAAISLFGIAFAIVGAYVVVASQ